MPSITDKFNKAGNGSGTYPVVGIVSANRAANEAILSCEDLTGWATDTPVHFSTYRLAQDGTVDTTSQTDWKGIVNGNTITNLTRIAGANDTGNSVGDYVEMNPTIGWLDDIVTGLLASHKQDGTLKDGIVSTAKIADGAVTAAKIGNKAVTTAKIDDNAVTADNIDFTTFNDIHRDYADNFGVTSEYASKASLKLPAGTYLAFGTVMLTGDADHAWVHMQLWDNTNNESLTSGVNGFWEGDFYRTNTASFSEKVILEEETIVQLRLQANGNRSTSTYNKALITALRVSPVD